MFWEHHYYITPWWHWGIGLLLCAVVIGLVVWAVSRAMSQRSSSASPGGGAEDVLRHRFAAGEIDEEEFNRRLETLRRK
jgi:putative membrane protein